MTRLLAAFFLLALVHPAFAKHKPVYILSAQLPVIENRRLQIQIPAELKLDTAPDGDQDWQPVEATVECSLLKPKDSLDGIVIQIIRWPITSATRAGTEGDLSGAPFKTTSGLEGIRIDNRIEDDEKPHCFSGLMIYNASHTGAIFIKVLPRPEVRIGTPASRDLAQLSTEIFDGIRLLK
jgi:hypothetical protein